MSEQMPGKSPHIRRVEPPQECPYCGAMLDPAFYFCLACATPYKHWQAMLTPLRPMAPTDGQRVAAKAPQVWTLFWTYLGVCIGVSVLGALAFDRSQFVLRMVLGSIALTVTTCIFAVRYWPALKVQFKRFGLASWPALTGLAILAPLLAVNYYYHGWLRGLEGVEARDMTEALEESGLSQSALVVFICVCPAIVEEIAFRGLVQHWLQAALTPFKAMVLASALFVTLHFSILTAPYLFALAMLLGWTKYKTGSLYPAMLIHFLHNYVVLEFFW